MSAPNCEALREINARTKFGRTANAFNTINSGAASPVGAQIRGKSGQGCKQFSATSSQPHLVTESLCTLATSQQDQQRRLNVATAKSSGNHTTGMAGMEPHLKSNLFWLRKSNQQHQTTAASSSKGGISRKKEMNRNTDLLSMPVTTRVSAATRNSQVFQPDGSVGMSDQIAVGS